MTDSPHASLVDRIVEELTLVPSQAGPLHVANICSDAPYGSCINGLAQSVLQAQQNREQIVGLNILKKTHTERETASERLEISIERQRGQVTANWKAKAIIVIVLMDDDSAQEAKANDHLEEARGALVKNGAVVHHASAVTNMHLLQLFTRHRLEQMLGHQNIVDFFASAMSSRLAGVLLPDPFHQARNRARELAQGAARVDNVKDPDPHAVRVQQFLEDPGLHTETVAAGIIISSIDDSNALADFTTLGVVGYEANSIELVGYRRTSPDGAHDHRRTSVL